MRRSSRAASRIAAMSLFSGDLKAGGVESFTPPGMKIGSLSEATRLVRAELVPR